ncbi:MAG: NAD(P)H-binding protein [Nocardioides sp.]|nr:NAD(P)H-binding protein [Nocardioides sp.]
MRLAIFGANGRTGRELAQQALDRGYAVTAVVRDVAKMPLRNRALTLAPLGDLGDQRGVTRTLDGADAVLSGIGPRGRKDAPVATPAIGSIVSGLETAGLRRVIVVSAAPVAPPPGDSLLNRRIPLPAISALLKPVYDDLRAMESILAASGSDWTAFRPPKLTNGPVTGRYRTTIGSSVRRGYTVSRADLAHAMLEALDRPETKGTVVGIAD